MTLDLFQPISETQKERINSAIPEMPPHEPGVYTMYDHRDQVLYVGKAKDLQKRVTSYRYSKSKKTQRMIAHINRIGFEICKSETDAILLENLLIRSLRPPFNVANKKPETYYYISSTRRGNKREFRLSMRQLQDYPKCYGCFKGHLRVRKGLGALLKLLYLKYNDINHAHFLPSQLLKRITPMRFNIKLGDQTGVQVDQLLKGSSALFIEELEHLIDETSFRDKFTRMFFENEIEHLKMFYRLGPERNHLMKTELGLESALIPQDQLDDLHVLLDERRN
ncbi:MAG: nucleotide excision repair endonuclease [Balneolaceae bacterium]|nr:nucleotide excision repair endonuclease [Balneolaceae bacterium]MBO6545496.1 nucleotide excision repair endonuclease [Balneolaceae bacterium]MBO6646892.1 nucleotide excision repair endonuclease [Balneolaceae bacterium]